jgi:hypothetical protein
MEIRSISSSNYQYNTTCGVVVLAMIVLDVGEAREPHAVF